MKAFRNLLLDLAEVFPGKLEKGGLFANVNWKPNWNDALISKSSNGQNTIEIGRHALLSDALHVRIKITRQTAMPGTTTHAQDVDEHAEQVIKVLQICKKYSINSDIAKSNDWTNFDVQKTYLDFDIRPF